MQRILSFVLFLIIYHCISNIIVKGQNTDSFDDLILNSYYHNLLEELSDTYIDSIIKTSKSKVSICQYEGAIINNNDYGVNMASVDLDGRISNPIIPLIASIDKTKSVGDIEIVSGWNQTGAKTYNIPIKSYPGINDFQPHISLCYNSQQGMSTVGQGWSISGIPIITRSGKSLYYDNKSEGIRMDLTDSFSIDGMRLIRKSCSDGYVMYESEQGNILVKGYCTDNIIKYFEVFYPDGSKARFGFSDNSENRLQYPITTISDINGNTIDYIYQYSYETHRVLGKNYYYIDKIEYNNSAIEFKYKNLSGDYLYYIGGTEIYLYQCLESIICTHNEENTGSYFLFYETREEVPLLSEVGYGIGTEKFNPICFLYGEGNTGQEYDVSQTQLIKWFVADDSNKIRAVRGRFNYDSIDEGLIMVPNHNPYYHMYSTRGLNINGFYNYFDDSDIILLYSNLGEYFPDPMPDLTAGIGFIDILCADLQGNQEDFIVKINNTVSGNLENVIFNVYQAHSINGLSLNYKRIFRFNTGFKDDVDYSVQPKFYYAGDFNGDGKMEILAVSAHCPIGQSQLPTTCYLFDLENDKLLYEDQPFEYNMTFVGTKVTDANYAANNSDKLFVFDADGDGKTDICIINESGTHVYTFDIFGDGSMCIRELGCNNSPNRENIQDKNVIVGDYNGDGLLDLLLSPQKGETGEELVWITYYSKGNGTFLASKFYGPENEDDDHSGFLMQDVNNDGQFDLIKYNSAGFITYPSIKSHNLNIGFRTEYSATGSILVPIDINSHNQTSQILSVKEGIVTKYSSKLDKGKDHLLTGMINSLGLIENNEYHSLREEFTMDSSYTYIGGDTSEYPYIKIRENIMVLTRTECTINSELCSKQTLEYENAVFHKQGLGFRGFEQITSYDFHNNKTILTYDPYNQCVVTNIVSPEKEITNKYTINTDSDKVTKILLESKTENDLLSGYYSNSVYSYDSYGFPTSEIINYSDGIIVKQEYIYQNLTDPNDTYSLGFIIDNIKTTIRNEDEYKERIKFLSYNRRKPLESAEYVNGNQTKRIKYNYDTCGNIIEQLEYPYSSNKALYFSYTYAFGSALASRTYPWGGTEYYSYDNNGRINGITDYTGTITIQYDAMGREKIRIKPDGTSKEVIYNWTSEDSTGLYTITTHTTGKPTKSYTYDALGRIVQLSDTRFDGRIRNIDRQYDQYGNMSKESEPYIGSDAPEWIEYKYDKYDRLEYISEPSGRRTQHSYMGSKIRSWVDGKYIDRTYDSLNKLISAYDVSGGIDYTLAADGQPIKVTCHGGIDYWYYYDKYRRQETVVDVSGGTITYGYDDRGNRNYRSVDGIDISYYYDDVDRPKKIITPEFAIEYSYDDNNRLKGISSSNGTFKSLNYDMYGRISNIYEMAIDEVWMQRDFSYKDNNISSIQYTSHLGDLITENYEYSNGTLCNGSVNGISVFSLKSEDNRGEISRIDTGELVNYYENEFGLPSKQYVYVKCRSDIHIQELTYGFDPVTSNILYRTNACNKTENYFSYDELNRLTASNELECSYNILGNIVEKSNVGKYEYNIFHKPHAVSDINLYEDNIYKDNQDIPYTSFNRPQKIIESDYSADFIYNGDFDRVRMRIFHNSDQILTRYYLGDCYELDDNKNSISEKLYLFGDYYDAPAVLIKENGIYKIYYILRDYLGSISKVVDSDGEIIQELEYDPWGIPVDPISLNYYENGESPDFLLGRGYTGHEHLPWFGLINMNARLYDPLVGRFLSPDPYIQMPDYTQGLNRFSYALNNPLRYVDKDGEFFWAAVGIAAVIGGVVNVAVHWKTIKSKGFWTGASYFLTGAVAGGIGAAVGIGTAVGFGSMLGVTAASYTAATTGFINGAIVGMAEGATSGFILGAGNSLIEGSNFRETMTSGLWGAVGGGISGGISGGLTGGLQAYAEGKNFWTGAERGNYTLYYGFDKQGNVKYVGITGREPEIRFYEHSMSNSPRADLSFEYQKTYLFHLESRILEQKYINKYGLEKFGGQLFNKRNEISPKFWDLYNIKPSKFR